MTMTTQQLRSIATTMTGPELASAARQTAQQAGSATVKKFFEANKGTLMALLPKHFDAERMLKLALGALRTTPKLAGASLSSLLGSVVTCAQLGLEPNTPLGHAYLLPFEKREKRGDQWVTTETQVQVIIGYKGMLDLARRSGQIVSIAAHEVCEKDEFRFAYGLDEELVHRPAMTDRGAVIGFYSVAKLVGGGYSFEFMSTDEVNHIRDKAAEKNRAKKGANGRPIITGPWADNYVEMGRKTALRRLFKYLPISIESLAFATAIDGNAVASAAPLEEIAFEASHREETVDQETGEIHDSHPLQLEHQRPVTVPQQTTQAEPDEILTTSGQPTKPARKTSGQDITMTFAKVASMIESSKNSDTLDIALDMIRLVADEQQREELAAIGRRVAAAIEASESAASQA
jgi:recombination protein RecT